MYYAFNNKGNCVACGETVFQLPDHTILQNDAVYEIHSIKLVNGAIVEVGVIDQHTLLFTREDALAILSNETARRITKGFLSSAVEPNLIYDSTEADQLTLTMMHSASLSPDFATTEPYNGFIPIRAKRTWDGEKEVFYHNKAQMQRLIDDLALHIGACKHKGWQYQQLIESSDNLEALVEKIKRGA